MAKLTIFVFLAAFVALSTAASFGGAKDYLGNYWDFTTNQYSSALTGKVYNTVPVAPVAYAPPVAPFAYASPVAPVAPAAVASPYYYGAYPYGAAYIAPAWK